MFTVKYPYFLTLVMLLVNKYIFVLREKPQVPVLDPNHPLLEKFQQALKEHLEKQLEHLSEEVFELVCCICYILGIFL